MDDPLLVARKLSKNIRFKGDSLTVSDSFREFNHDSIEEIFTQSDLPITKDLTPDIYNSLETTCSKLSVPINSVNAYVYASHELQAQCYSGNDQTCVIRISSSLIDLLEFDEINFVIGHELAHFLYKHGIININSNHQSYKYLIQKRSQEISADRLGYLATNSLDVAIKALIKTVSGLKSKYLRFDVNSYLSHLKEPKWNRINNLQYLTHPSILFRCRALLWFSTKVPDDQDLKNIDPKDVFIVDKKLMSDMKKFIDGPMLDYISEYKKDLEMWSFMQNAIVDNSFDKSEQNKFRELFGETKLKKMNNLLKGYSRQEVFKIINEKESQAINSLKKLIPNFYNEEKNRIDKKIKSLFNDLHGS